MQPLLLRPPLFHHLSGDRAVGHCQQQCILTIKAQLNVLAHGVGNRQHLGGWQINEAVRGLPAQHVIGAAIRPQCRAVDQHLAPVVGGNGHDADDGA